MFKLELPFEMQEADMQLHYSSEMVSINESDSQNEEEPHKEDLSDQVFQEVVLPTNEEIDISIEEKHEQDASPVLQFQSQSMADINSPMKAREKNVNLSSASCLGEIDEDVVLRPMRESISSPNIIKTKNAKKESLKNESRPIASRNAKGSKHDYSSSLSMSNINSRKGGNNKRSSQDK